MSEKRFWPGAAPVALAVIAAFLAFERLAPRVRRTIWAEDGPLFIAQAFDGVGLGELFVAHGGYLHVAPRLAGGLVVELLATKKLAIGVNIAACVMAGIIAAVVYVCAEEVLPSRLLRAWLGSMMVLLPLAGVEVVANLTNLHWFFMWGAFWALLYRPRSVAGGVACGVFLLLSTLSEIQTVALAPIAFALCWYRRKEPPYLSVVACYSLGIALQIRAAMSTPRQMQPRLPGLVEAAQLLGQQVFMPLWSTEMGSIREALLRCGPALYVLAAAPVLLGAGLVAAYGDRRARVVTALAIGLGLGLFGLAHTVNELRRFEPGEDIMRGADILLRYGVAPSLFLLSVVALGIQAAWQQRVRWAVAVGTLSAVALAIAALVNFRPELNLRRPETAWPKELSRARKHCRQSGEEASAVVRVSPHDNWVFALPCSRVLE